MTSAQVWTFLATLQLKAAAFVALVLSIVYVTRQLSSQNRYIVLRMALGVVTLLPLLTLLLPAYAIPIGWLESQRVETATLGLRANALGEVPVAEVEPPLAMETVVLIGYLSVTMLLLLRTAIGALRTRNEVSRYERIDQPQAITMLERIRCQLGLKQSVELVLDPNGAGPYVWGIRKQVVAVPKEFLDVAPDVQRTVLTHELIHIARHDAAISLLARILGCLYWINPALWLLSSRLKLEMEQSCDDRAVGLGINAADYAGHLLKALQHFDVTRRPSSAVAMARASSIKQRVRSLLNTHRKRDIMSTSRSIAICTGLMIVGATLGALAAKPTPVAAEQAQQAAEATRKTLIVARMEAANSANASANTASLLAALKRQVPDGCEASEISALTANSAEVVGHCANTTKISAFMRNVKRAGGDPSLIEARTVEGHTNFKMQVGNLQSLAVSPAR